MLATVVASGAVVAVVIAPPFLAAGLGVRELDRRLEEAGADFTRIPRFPTRSTILANDGKTVLAHVYLDNRQIVSLDEISPALQRAVLAIEDSTFYEHGAVNVRSLFRALIENVRAGEVVRGGSTITQQLVKNTLGLDPSDLSVARKFQEAALALRVEEQYSKDEILAMYLNQVYLGNRMYGVGTASQFYFRKPASRLTLAQGALLAGLIRAPAYYDPVARPYKAWLRRNDVLNRMVDLGWLSEEEAAQVKTQPLGLAKRVGQPSLPDPPFIVQYVKEQLVADPYGWYEVLGDTPEARAKSLSEGGLRIVTTFDPAWQRAAQRAANLPWARTPYHPQHKPPADLAIVSIENATGAIRTMLSGKHFDKDQVNTVTTPHQPGSSFKPYILAAAFEQGIAPTATYSGVQGVIDDPRCETNGAPWIVYNAEGSSRGDMNLFAATADSVNAVFARLILDVGPENVVRVAKEMGVQSPLVPVCALATGSIGISPLDQASGYQTLANGGIHCKPYAVQEITIEEQVIFRQRPDCERVMKASIAYLVTDLLTGPVTYGTAASAFSGWSPWPIAGKTGTADLNKQVWFAGYTRQVSTAVWVGSQGAPYPLSEYWGYDVFGGSICAPIWRAYMAQVMAGMPALGFPQPSLVRVPSVVGLSKVRATEVLRAAGFRVTTETVDSYLTPGTVAEQNPAGGALTIPGGTVTLGISNGVAPTGVVPKVRGMTKEEAIAALKAANFAVTVVEVETTDKNLVGIVLDQDPAPKTELLEGSTVTIMVGVKAKPSPSPTPSPTPSPSP